MTNILKRFNAIALEFVGDAIICLFDEEHVGKNHAEKAVVAAVLMQYIMKDINAWNKKHNYPEFEIGIGVNTGNAYVGYIGSKDRLEYDAIGSTMNLVSRIESYSTGGQVLISEECRKNINIELKILKSFSILPKGYADNVQVYLVGGIGEPYNIDIDDNEEILIPLRKPIEIIYNLINNKTTEQKNYEGSIVEASQTSLLIETKNPITIFDNIRLNYNGSIYCKVISKSKRGVLLRITSKPINFRGFDID